MTIDEHTLATLDEAYGWGASCEGNLWCLIAGDQGYDDCGASLAELRAAAARSGSDPKAEVRALAEAACDDAKASSHERLELLAELSGPSPDLRGLSAMAERGISFDRRTATENAIGNLAKACLRALEPEFPGWRERRIGTATENLLEDHQALRAYASNGVGIDGPSLCAVYPWGSRLYGCHKLDSDIDLVVVCDDEGAIARLSGPHDAPGDASARLEADHWHLAAIDLRLHTRGRFLEMAAANDIVALECLSIPKERVPLDLLGLEIRIDPPRLRASISERTSHSFVKAKKKLAVEGDLAAGRKSLFHALRIASFGLQAAREGRISDFGEANALWAEIGSAPADWGVLRGLFEPRLKAILHEFRLAAPKTPVF